MFPFIHGMKEKSLLMQVLISSLAVYIAAVF